MDEFVIDSDFCTCCGTQIKIKCNQCQAYMDQFGSMLLTAAIAWAEGHTCEKPGANPKRTRR